QLGDPERDPALAQDVLHRLPEPEVDAERQRGHQLCKADLLVVIADAHRPNVGLQEEAASREEGVFASCPRGCPVRRFPEPTEQQTRQGGSSWPGHRRQHPPRWSTRDPSRLTPRSSTVATPSTTSPSATRWTWRRSWRPFPTDSARARTGAR